MFYKNITKLGKYSIWISVAIVTVLIAVISFAFFSDRVITANHVETGVFDAGEYTIEKVAPQGYFSPSDTIDVVLKESNQKDTSVLSEIILEAEWVSPVPDVYPWGNAGLGNLKVSLDGAEIPYTVNKDHTITISLPQKELSANTNDIERNLTFEIPSDLNATGTLKHKVKSIELTKESSNWSSSYDSDKLSDLNFNYDIAWNISLNSVVLGEPNRDVLAVLTSPDTTETDGYGLRIIKNGQNTNINLGRMMNWNQEGETPWASYSIVSLSIDEKISTIGNYAFAGEEGITFLNLPSTVDEIGISAFDGSGLTGEITIPASVSYIESLAFGNLSNVNALTFKHKNGDSIVLPDNESEGTTTNGAFYVKDYVKTTINAEIDPILQDYNWVNDHRAKIGIKEVDLSYEDVEVGKTIAPALTILPESYDAYQSIKYKIVSGDAYISIDPSTGVVTGLAEGTATVQVTIVDANGKSVVQNASVRVIKRVPVLAAQDTWFTQGNTGLKKSQVTSITFSDKAAPATYAASWDASEGKTGGITAYAVDNNPAPTTKPASDLDVGDSVYLNVNGVKREFIVVQQGNPDSSIYDASCNGTWLMMKNVYESRTWADSKTNTSYEASTIHPYLNSTFLSLLDPNVQSAIKQVKIPYGLRDKSGSSNKNLTLCHGSNGLSTKIFLLSSFEVGIGGGTNPEKSLDGKLLSYFSDSSKLPAYNLGGAQVEWWTRTVIDTLPSHATITVTMDSTRYPSVYPTASYGVRPAFILSEDAQLDPETNEIVAGSDPNPGGGEISSDSTYSLHIVGNGSGTITANKDSSSAFAYFSSATDINSLDLLDTSKATDMSSMFDNCNSLTSLDLSDFDTTQVTNMTFMFGECYALTSIKGLASDGWNTGNVEDMSYMFAICESLSSLDLSKFNTEKVENMEQMFYYCTTLTSLDCSSFDTSNVTDMNCMFYVCESLESVDVSSFDTSKVTDFMLMFDECRALTTLDISNFDTTSITDETGLRSFAKDCDSLTTIILGDKFAANGNIPVGGQKYSLSDYVSPFYVENLTPTTVIGANSVMKAYDWVADNRAEKEPILAVGDTWFDQGDHGLNRKQFVSITLSKSTAPSTYAYKWDASDGKKGTVTAYAVANGSNYDLHLVGDGSDKIIANANSSSAFSISIGASASGFNNVKAINNLSLLDTSKVTNMDNMFGFCKSLTSLDVSSFDTRNVTNMFAMFSECHSLTSLDLINFDTSNVTDMALMFDEGRSLTSLNVSSFDTKNVESFTAMFEGCSKLTSLDVSGFDTSKAESMRSMFDFCSGLTSLDLSGFDTRAITSTNGLQMIAAYCPKLTTIILNENFGQSNNVPAAGGITGMFTVSNLTPTKVIGANSVMKAYDWVTDKRDVTHLSELAQPILAANSTWYDQGDHGIERTSITSIEFSKSIAPSSYHKKWDASEGKVGTVTAYAVADGSNYKLYLVGNGSGKIYANSNSLRAFNNFQALTGFVNLSLFDTSKTTNMNQMFCYCYNLADIDLSTFDTSNVKYMQYMFYCCYDLDLHGVENWKTGNVTNMQDMFYQCWTLSSLDLSEWNTGKVTTMKNMFNQCTGLTSLDLSGWSNTVVEDMQWMIANCTSLKTLNLSNFGTNKVTNMQYMFTYSYSITSLDLRSFNTSNVTTMYSMFSDCSGLNTLLIDSSFNTDNVTTMFSMFNGCSSLTSLDVSNFNTSKVTSMQSMFNSCSSLTSLDVSSFNTSNVTSMGNMFANCSSLTALDLSNFDTSKVTGMYAMFYKCAALKTLDINNFITSSLSSPGNMFNGCSAPITIYVSNSTVQSWVKATTNFPSSAKVVIGKPTATSDFTIQSIGDETSNDSIN